MIGVEQYEELVGAQVDTPRGTLLTKPVKALTDEEVTERKQPKRTAKRKPKKEIKVEEPGQLTLLNFYKRELIEPRVPKAMYVKSGPREKTGVTFNVSTEVMSWDEHKWKRSYCLLNDELDVKNRDSKCQRKLKHAKQLLKLIHRTRGHSKRREIIRTHILSRLASQNLTQKPS